MPRTNLEELLLDLGPVDLDSNQSQKVGDLRAESAETAAALARELRLLKLLSSRKVVLPNDSHFASIRLSMLARIEIRQVSWWDRVVAKIFPESIRPVPSLLAGGILALAILLTAVYFPRTKTQESQLAYGPYLSLSETYGEQFGKLEKGDLSEQELKEYREILLMSTAILGSPSSLSRSRAMGPVGRL